MLYLNKINYYYCSLPVNGIFATFQNMYFYLIKNLSNFSQLLPEIFFSILNCTFITDEFRLSDTVVFIKQEEFT